MNRGDLVRLLAAASIVPVLGAAPEPIQLVCVPTEDMTDLYYAVKTGMMAHSGLDVSLVYANSGSAATAAVVAGTYQIAKTSLLALFNAHLQDIPLIVVAPHILNEADNPQSLLQIAPDSPFKSGADLNGKTIGVPSLGDFNTLATRAWVDKTGGDWHSLKFVEIPNSALEAAIGAHRIDAAILQTPQLDISLQADTTKTLAYANAAISPRFTLGGYVARRDWTVNHAAELQTFTSTLAEGTRYVNTHRAETAPLVAELTKITLADVSKMHRTINGTSLDPALVQPLIDAAAKYGAIAHSFPAREILWPGYRASAS